MARHIFIVSRSHRDLYEFLAKQFVDDPNVRVIYDRRTGDQRQESPETTSFDRRYRDRRARPEVDEELRSRSHAIITLDA